MHCELMLEKQGNETPHIWFIIHFHLYFPNAPCPWIEKKFQQLMTILPIKVSLRQNFHTVMMQRKHCLLVKAIIMKIIHLVLMVLMGELKMFSRDFRLFGKTAWDFLSCDKHLISGVTMRISLRRSPNDFVIMSEQPNKQYQV